MPDGFAVRLDPRTRRRDGGAALLGGSPLRLLRLSARACAMLAGDRLEVRDPGTAALAARLLDAGLAHPAPAGAGAPVEVTVVVPVRDRPDGLTRLLAALRADPATAGLPVVVVDDGSRTPVPAIDGVRVVRHERSLGPAAARNTGLATATTGAVAFLDSDCVPRRGWLDRLCAHLADPRLAAVAPRIVPLAPGRTGVGGYETVAGALDMGSHPAPVRPLSAVSYVPSAALLVRRSALGHGFDPAMRVAEDVDLVWRLTGAGWRVRYDPGAEVAHEHPTEAVPWLRRRAFYGTGAALLAARHGAAVSPVVLPPAAAAAWVLAVAGRRPGRVAAVAVLAGTGVRLAGRLARPGRPRPLVLAAALTAGGQLAAARTLARAVTRHHWPVALAAALLSHRARRWVVAAAVADAAAGWWPHRGRIDPGTFALGRRAEDLAYGAGLWRGALRARDVRALLPRRPPRA